MRSLVFVTNNQHKINEIRNIASGMFRILSLQDLGFTEEIPEEAPDLEGNASAKAWHIYNRFKVNCFADDTGLEVEALGGRPGVRSARYAGDESDPEKNIIKLLSELAGIKNRKARFRTVISLIINGEETFFEGVVEGKIIDEKRGQEGFGYDPVFVPDGYDQTFAEMPPGTKNHISHRSRAVNKLISRLRQL